MTQIKIKLPPIIKTISDELSKQNYKAILVGGCVRDIFLDLPIKDYDIEVFGLEDIEILENVLSKFGKVNLVGKSFGVLKFKYKGDEYDFSLPRCEEKTGIGHKGFSIVCDSRLDFEGAAKRRDFTINAMGYDIANNKFLDPFGGLDDIEHKKLKAVDKNTFIEDPLRVYRAAGFCSRFEFGMEHDTFLLCIDMAKKDEFAALPKERIFVEFKKILLKSPKPSIGFELLKQMGVIEYFRELYDIIGVPQNPLYHPEGDVWMHTMMVIDEMAKLKSGNEKFDLKLMFAALCHDLGKATNTQMHDGVLKAIGHEDASVELTKKFLYRLTNEHGFISSVLPLVKHHEKPIIYFSNHAKDTTIRKLSAKVKISDLVILSKADFLGRATKEVLNSRFEAGEWLLKKAIELGVENAPPKQFLQGRDLIARGLKPSKYFGEILRQIYDKQLNGEIRSKEEAFLYLSKIINL